MRSPLFPGDSGPHSARIAWLGELACLGLQWPGSELLLEDVASWLAKIGLAKPYAAQLVKGMRDTFCLPDADIGEWTHGQWAGEESMEPGAVVSVIEVTRIRQVASHRDMASSK